MEYSMNDIKLEIKSLTFKIDATKNQLQNHMTTININNNNNKLILRSRPSRTPNQCMRHPCLWDEGPPLQNHLTAKVYGGIHTLPPSGFELVTSQEETHVLNHQVHTQGNIYKFAQHQTFEFILCSKLMLARYVEENKGKLVKLMLNLHATLMHYVVNSSKTTKRIEFNTLQGIKHVVTLS